MKTSILRVTGSVASIASCLVLFGGVASAQASTTTGTISHTGEDSHNVIEINDKCEVTINNDNNVVIVNTNTQGATSGPATAGGTGDTESVGALTETNSGGSGSSVDDVTSGDATNNNNTGINVTIDNSANITCFVNQVTPPPVGGSGAGAPVTPVATQTVAPAPVGGSGAGEAVVQQVAVRPVGGVGAGTGGLEYLSGLAAVTLLSGAWATRRLQRSLKS